MGFVESFTLTAPALVSRVPISEPRNGIPSGVYNGGLITVLDADLGRQAIAPWQWLLGEDAAALASTWGGDLIFWSERYSGVFMLDAQRGSSTFVDRDVTYLFDVFLSNPDVRQQVLQNDAMKLLSTRIGTLAYGECFIAEPWPRLGGHGTLDTYVRGDLTVYLSLVGQAVHGQFESLRSSE
ncbi:T6SS immunity protein Tdi1 domain-containing protein [Cupriavidus sp. PET2-C1]